MSLMQRMLGMVGISRKVGLPADFPKVWAMEPSRLEQLCARLAAAEISGEAAAAAASQAASTRARKGFKKLEDMMEDPPPYSYAVENGVAVFPLSGVIQKSVPWIYDYFGIHATGVQDVQAALAAALADKAVDSILFEIDSPGGSVSGVQELADAIRAARAVKPVAAHISDLGASAAYWLASQASRVTANQTAEVGSIGVYMVMVDSSKAAEAEGFKVHLIASGPHKGAGVPGVPLTEEQIAVEQEMVNKLAEQFVGAIAAGRGMAATEVASLATGRTWLAADALRAKLIDGVANYESALAAARPAGTKGDGSMSGQRSGTAAASPAPGSQSSAGEAPVAIEAAKQLEAMEAAFPADLAFARDAWKRGLSPEQAKGELAAKAPEQLKDAQARIKDLEGQLAKAQGDSAAAEAKHKEELAAKDKEIADLKALASQVGHKPLEQKPASAEAAGAVAAYNAKREELLKAGDVRPEETIANKFPEVSAAYLAAVNAGAQASAPAAAAAAKPAEAGKEGDAGKK
ncbi:MAG TPA: S49 family peptidase [Planctomycetota bacterium]|nr:S49 family peptidase [Planctomycetota bacterium]